MDQPQAGNALLYANRQQFVMLISSNLVGCSTGKSAGSLREDIELAANSQRASERLYKPVSRGRERLMSKSGQTLSFGDVCSMSALDRFSDSSRTFSKVRVVPESDICTATNRQSS